MSIAIPSTTVEGLAQNNLGYFTSCIAPSAGQTLPTTASTFAVGCVVQNTGDGSQWVNIGTVAAPVWNRKTVGRTGSAAINSTATATAAQVATGYITSTSAAATTITLPTGTLLGAYLNAGAGTVFDLIIDNTAGANTVTIAVSTNGVVSTAGVDTAGSFGDLTVASGVTGLARYTIMFSSATAYAFTRTA